jgi:hypothetical protein
VTIDLRSKLTQQEVLRGFHFNVKVGDFAVIYATESPGTGYTWLHNNPDHSNAAPAYTITSNSYLALPTVPSYINGQAPAKIGGGSGTRTIFLEFNHAVRDADFEMVYAQPWMFKTWSDADVKTYSNFYSLNFEVTH